uniref:Adenylate kinase 7b n=1 Tax=Neogobius melanostomus TaxID=47308 RepID=A0A8C6UPN7_9GOBI
MEKVKPPPKRVFVNNIDSYSSKYIAKFLCDSVVGAYGEGEDEKELDTSSSDKAFAVVGTVSEESSENTANAKEQYCQLTREELLPKLMDCDVIVYNITQHQDQVEEAFWAVTSLQNELNNFPGPKMFILVSTVMTWACRKPIDPKDEERPFTDEDFRRQRPHPNFKAHNDLEKWVIKLGKMNRTMFSTYVVASGMQYGMGEHTFHYFFKTSWQGLKPQTPVFGEGTNIVPTIHISDLASVIQNVIEHRPKPYYLLAVDFSHNTLEEIIQAISKALGSGKIEKMPVEEAYLIREISLYYMTVNLRMESAHLKDLLPIPWQCEHGLVENINHVVEEYRQNRGLLPIRICVMGPPAVGKSTLAKTICDHYKLHHVRLRPVITETLAQLVSPTYDEKTAEAQELFTNLNKSMEENGGTHQLVRDKLMSKPCRNQGFVLDGFPKAYDDAKELFESKSHGKIRGRTKRVMNLPEAQVQKNNYTPANFLKRQARYRHRNKQDAIVADVYDKFDIPMMKLGNSKHPDCLQLMEKIIKTVGPPRNYGPSIEELEEEERRIIKERRREEMQRKAEEEEREAEEARERAARWDKWSKASEELKHQEEETLEVDTAEMRTYLTEHVMPTLSQGLVACCAARPQDPVDFLAEYLLTNNPHFL